MISIRSIRTEDWLIFLFFFASPTIKSGGELIFLITALFGIGITIRMGFKAWCMQLSRIDIILAVAISTPFFIRLISLSWTEFAQVSTPMAFTNIHYALWPFLLILLRRSEKPVAMMIAGISMASLIGLIWLTVEVVCGYTAELNF